MSIPCEYALRRDAVAVSSVRHAHGKDHVRMDFRNSRME
jgi:hypothetical protein